MKKYDLAEYNIKHKTKDGCYETYIKKIVQIKNQERHMNLKHTIKIKIKTKKEKY